LKTSDRLSTSVPALFFKKVPLDGDIHPAGGQYLSLRDHICRIVVARQLEGIDLEQLHVGIELGEPAKARLESPCDRLSH
jgi:hypothetical protein